MRILLTNDDGILAPGLYALYQALKPLGKVTVVAPDLEQSAVGHGITLSHPIWYQKFNRNNRFFGYGVSGTPADCVKIATSVILKKDKPDVVVSGINLGQNEGCSVFYSGTVAGAREGALMGIPSVAVSLATFENPNFKVAAAVSKNIVKQVMIEGLPKGTFLNVNVPAKSRSQIKGTQVTRQCTKPIHGTFHKRINPHLREYYWLSGRLPVSRRQRNDQDTYALANDYITVTPILCDLTDNTFINNLQEWKF